MIDIKTIPQRYARYYTYLEPVIADPLVRGYFSLVASFLLVAFFLFFALSPTINTVVSLQKKITDYNKLLAALETKKANLITAQQNYSQIESFIPTLLVALPVRPTPQTVIDEVTNIASASGVTVTGLSFKRFTLIGGLANSTADPEIAKDSPGLAPLGVSGLSVSLSVSGSKASARSYLGKLEDSLRYLRFRTISVAVTGDKLTVDAVGHGYYYVGNSSLF